MLFLFMHLYATGAAVHSRSTAANIAAAQQQQVCFQNNVCGWSTMALPHITRFNALSLSICFAYFGWFLFCRYLYATSNIGPELIHCQTTLRGYFGFVYFIINWFNSTLFFICESVGKYFFFVSTTEQIHIRIYTTCISFLIPFCTFLCIHETIILACIHLNQMRWAWAHNHLLPF